MALWISDASDEKTRESIGKTFQEKLHPVNLSNLVHGVGGGGTPVQYSFDMHSDSFKRYAVGTQQRGRTHSSYHGSGIGEQQPTAQQLSS